MAAPVPSTVNNQDPRGLLLQINQQLQYLGNQFSGSLNLSKGFVPLDIFSARFIDTNEIDALGDHGGLMAVDSVPMLQRVDGATDKAARLEWIANGVEEIQFPPVMIPPDFDPLQDASIHGIFAKETDVDTIAMDFQAWEGIGDTEFGGTSGTIAAALAEYSATLALADLLGHPLGFVTVSFTPGAHANDIVYCYGAWIEYTRV